MIIEIFINPGNRSIELMTFLILPLVLILFNKALCTGAGEREHKNSLNFLNKQRYCSKESKYHGIKLPELTDYVKTTNSIVNSVIEKEYIMFWQTLQLQGYEQDMDRLILQSKGAALADIQDSLYEPETYDYNSWSKVLRPFFKGSMKSACLKCVNMKSGNVLDCLFNVVKNCTDYEKLEREMIMCAINLLKMSMLIAASSFHNFGENELDRLRTDNRALSCIRNWDRNASIASIIFLTFHLNVRKIIAHVSKMNDDSKIIAKMQADLNHLVQAEFPHKLIREVRRKGFGNIIIRIGDVRVNRKYIVNEVRVLFVKTPRESIDTAPRICVEGSILYVSFEEHVGEALKFNNLTPMLESVIEKVSGGNFILDINPTILEISPKTVAKN